MVLGTLGGQNLKFLILFKIIIERINYEHCLPKCWTVFAQNHFSSYTKSFIIELNTSITVPTQ